MAIKEPKLPNSLIKANIRSISRQQEICEKIKDSTYYFREGNYANEVITTFRKWIFVKENQKTDFRKNIWIFGQVKTQARLFLAAFPKFRLPKAYPVNKTNHDFNRKRGNITGTDISNAYWRIAYLEGIITEKTYNRGLSNDLKELRLAALASLSQTKTYEIYHNGNPSGQYVHVKCDEQLDKVYKLIRYTCYGYMATIAEVLGNDFYKWETDCIFYYDTPKNRQLVNAACKGYRLQSRQMPSIPIKAPEKTKPPKRTNAGGSAKNSLRERSSPKVSK